MIIVHIVFVIAFIFSLYYWVKRGCPYKRVNIPTMLEADRRVLSEKDLDEVGDNIKKHNMWCLLNRLPLIENLDQVLKNDGTVDPRGYLDYSIKCKEEMLRCRLF